MMRLSAKRPPRQTDLPEIKVPPKAEAPRFNKGVLSQSIHTRCDLALYLSLLKPGTRAALGLPEALPSRPNVRLIKDAGIGFETQVYEALLAAFPDILLHARTAHPTDSDPGAVKWEERPLDGYLRRSRTGTWLLTQATFTLGERPAATLRRLGVSEADIRAMPVMGSFVPDLLAVRPRPAGHPVIAPDGTRPPLAAPRQVVTIVDAKHASEPNPSYEAEVVLYALLLANWLLEQGLDDRFAVDAEPLLWTRGGGGLTSLEADGASTEARVDGLLDALDRVNVAVHAQEIRRFVSEKIPGVLAEGGADWRALDWHVSPNCNTCDWLGHRDWLDRDSREALDRNPGHYCMTRAAASGHLSRVPGLTKGAAKALRASGVPDVASLVGLPPTHPGFRGHTLLAKWRRTLPEQARAIDEGCIEHDRRRVDGNLPANSDLTMYVGVDFDGGAGLLTGVALRSTFFRPRGPKAATPGEPTKPSFSEGSFVVERKAPEAERAAVLGFLRHVAGILSRAASTDDGPGGGGTHAARATAVTVFWSLGQYDALCQAVGRHLPAVLDDRDGAVRALAWLFPGASLQGNGGGDERMPPIVLLRGTASRLLRTPTVHAATLAGLVAAYRFSDGEPVLPHPFYAEPLTDGIPRERIYEIWAMGDDASKTFMVYPRDPVTNRQLRDAERVEKAFTRGDFVTMFGRALLTQARGLESVTRHVRRDFGDQLQARAPRISLSMPSWAGGVAFDAKLWVARAEFEASHERVACLARYLADPDEVEASHEALRLRALIERREDGTLVYEIEEGSRDAKLKAGDAELCISFEARPGFAAAAAWQLFPQGAMPEEAKAASYMRMHAVFGATLVELDRTALRAVVRPREPGGRRAPAILALRQAVMAQLGLDMEGGISLMAAMPPDITVKRLRRVMDEVGDPPLAAPDDATCQALGLEGREIPGTSPLTPMARVLWDARTLEGEFALDDARVAAALAEAAPIGLDASQTHAVERALRRRLTAVWGPPGTGKTKTIQGFLHGLLGEASQGNGGARILVTGPTYKAVGEVATRLLKGLSTARIPALVALIGATDRQMLTEPVTLPAHVRLIEAPAHARDPGFREAMESLQAGGTTVVCAITHQCARISEQLSDMLDIDPRRMLHALFDTVVIDEASQVDMATAAFPLALMRPDARLVVAGDHLQMPPVQAVEPPKGAERTVGSIQDYLTGRFGVPRTPLLVNYRSNADVVGYCRGLGYPPALSACFEETRVHELVDPRGPFPPRIARSWNLPWSLAIPELLPPERGLVALTYPDGMAGQANAFEASIVASTVLALRACTSRALDGHPDDAEAHGPWDDERFFRKGIGIVTPHRAQKARVVAALCAVFPNADPALIEDAVDTVERFQGGQRHVVVISFGVGDPDVISGEERFLMGLERTNVAISRAMAKCIVVMSREVATHIPADRAASASAHALRGVVDDWCRNKARHPVEGAPGRFLTAHWR